MQKIWPEWLVFTEFAVNSKVYLSQIRYLLVVILELNSVSEVQYKEVMIIDDE